MNFVRSIVTVSSLTMLSRVAGFIRDILTAAILGAGPANDAFVVALKLPNLFRRLFAEGALHVSFIPLFTGILQSEGQDKAKTFAEQSMSMLLTILLPFTVLTMIAMPYLIPVIATGFHDDPERFSLAVSLARITFPYLVLISLVALMGGMLNAMGRFGPFAEGPILFNASMISALVLAWAWPAQIPAAPALAWSVTIAGVLQFFWLRRALRQEGIKLRLVRPRLTPQVRRLMSLMAPGAFGAGAFQINIVLDIWLASFMPAGAISYLYYADRLNQLPLGIIGVAFGTTLLPMLSRQIKAGQAQAANYSISRAIEFALLLTFPAAVALGVISLPIITVLFERGSFTPRDSLATAHVLQAYALGIPAYVLVKVFASAFFAQENTSSPVKIALVTAVANTVLALAFVYPLQQTGLALATSLAGWLQVGLLAYGLWRRGWLKPDDRARQRGGRIILISLIMGAALAVGNSFLAGYFADEVWIRWLALAFLVGAGGLIYVVLGQWIGAFRLQDVARMLRRNEGA